MHILLGFYRVCDVVFCNRLGISILKMTLKRFLVGIAQCRVLDCDSKGCRCKSYYLPLLDNIHLKLNPLIRYVPALQLLEVNVNHVNFYTSALWYSKNIPNFYEHGVLISLVREKNHILKIFTKVTNLNKLYMVCNNKVFLSSGIILRFIKASTRRSLKKRMKVWYGYLKAGRLIFKNPLIVWFNDLIGKKTLLLNKLQNSGIAISWVFFRIFYLNYSHQLKTKRRIKRWVKKKYFRLSHNEHN